LHIGSLAKQTLRSLRALPNRASRALRAGGYRRACGRRPAMRILRKAAIPPVFRQAEARQIAAEIFEPASSARASARAAAVADSAPHRALGAAAERLVSPAMTSGQAAGGSCAAAPPWPRAAGRV